ncbi:MAG: DUF4476 domain-containing protein [Archangiaceae bacterium]|nr:DUF4476 domain-containing protein [Archangiaceae bacterium]
MVVCSTPALAQEELDTSISVPGMQVGMRAKVSTSTASSGVSVDCASNNGIRPQMIKFSGLDGAKAQIYAEDGSLEGEYTLPFNFEGRGDTYYRFVVSSGDGRVLLDKKLEVKQYVGCAARLAAGGVEVRPQRQARAPMGMAPDEFAALLAAVNAASFSDEKIGVVETAAANHWFTVDQVGQLIDAMSFSADKLKTLDRCRARLVDRQNAFRLLERFTFSADKQKAQALLR